ncbi:MAG: hypothetical protein KDK78_10580, partial [Chlamydiia bacterium]|nr:hypothetical protein [Chlamydiia bacterium]
MLSEIFLAKRGWTAWLCGALVIHLCNSGLAFGMSFLNRLFIDALQYHNREGFALYATAYLLCFSVTAPLSAWMRYSKQRAALEWRAQVSAAAYPYARRSDLDNTAERIQSDIATATEGALDLFLTACMSLIEAVAFAILLYS